MQMDVIPHGATAAYAAPEVLESLQLQFKGADPCWEGGVTMNGASADFWSVGVVLYKLLTGELPFSIESKGSVGLLGISQLCFTDKVTKTLLISHAPEMVSSQHWDDWENYAAVLAAQQTWVRAPPPLPTPPPLHLSPRPPGAVLAYICRHLQWCFVTCVRH